MSGVEIPEMELFIAQLGRGTILTKFSSRKGPEKKKFRIWRETRQIVWEKNSDKSLVIEVVNFRDIKDIRVGKSSKDFEKWPEDGEKHESSKCFVIFYGSEFRLSTLSLAASSEKECDLWVRSLKDLVLEMKESSYNVDLETWLRKQFYNLDSSQSPTEKGVMNRKELKAFLGKINCKLAKGRLRELFQEFDDNNSGDLGFEDFARLFQQLIHDPQILNANLQKYLNENSISYDQLSVFFKEEQDDGSIDVQAEMNRFLQDPDRIGTTNISQQEFLDYLYSKQNSIWDSTHDKVCQDMTRPLSHYYIASSHNTYLTGDQFSSRSSTKAYIRCLLNSCRSVELECWDGPDGHPFICHGHTLTSKIRLDDACRAIKDFAFTQSDYPLILSIEDHCSVPQQRRMAQVFVETFGNTLIVSQLDKSETALPSPEQLRGRIILKHKKLPEGLSDGEQIAGVEDLSKEMDLSNTIKNGTMYIEDNSGWAPRFFVLTKRKLLYSDMSLINSAGEQVIDVSTEEVTPQELHLNEKWFHGKLKGGRITADALITNYKQVDGTFLVRESGTFIGDFILSAWMNGKIVHARIHTKYDQRQLKYYLAESMLFDSLYSLIMYHRQNYVRTREVRFKLGDAVPLPTSHEGKPWFHTIDRVEAENSLRRVPLDGTFLVRPSSTVEAKRFVISLRAKKVVNHCLIKEDRERGLFIVGQNEFETILELVTYYQKHPFFLGVCLKYPLTEELPKTGMKYFENSVNHQVYTDYLNTSAFEQEPETTNPISARALYAFTGGCKEDLSFKQNDVITNIVKKHEDWWQGDLEGRSGYFPSNHVSLIEENSSILGDLRKGCLDLTGAFVELRCVSDTVFPWRVFVEHDGILSTFGVEREDDGILWNKALRSVVDEIMSELETEKKRMERLYGIAQELSSIVIYCCSVNKFSLKLIANNGRTFHEIRSFPETAEELFRSERDFFMWYHHVQLTRVYPKGQRLGSSNFNPIPFWSVGCQMVALNYQTGDKYLQVNHGKFRQNGGCGYVLRPEFMFASDNSYQPEPIEYVITVISGRHLCKSGRGIISPFVELELVGSDYKHQSFGQLFKTRTVQNNCLNPYWNETFSFRVQYPECSLLRIVVHDEDMFGARHFVGQCTYQINCLRNGYRSIQLLNCYSEEIELASLLVHFRTVARNSN